MLTGLPGLGKSQVQCHFVACASAGLKWPDGASPIAPASVIKIAKRKLGIVSFKEAGVMNGPWYWKLPEVVL